MLTDPFEMKRSEASASVATSLHIRDYSGSLYVLGDDRYVKATILNEEEYARALIEDGTSKAITWSDSNGIKFPSGIEDFVDSIKDKEDLLGIVPITPEAEQVLRNKGLVKVLEELHSHMPIYNNPASE
jgi:hypothetical protein|tara:strand:- start:692 stop:1078 length:387 start_codon:yes stop_codon:yes gene_type:complete